ncbi:TetR/AcrR family transcriptional regulator [Amycolatopsis acidicola]|uniref:TetR/AcrR family transcriptional regulator n=1 Tax=Amycolatopsis acidicola TaxID=2596893 RepID=UPI001FB842F4|nr:TetR/AcrR family transcriptional regulator [Amycolatopsis acidicola]
MPKATRSTGGTRAPGRPRKEIDLLEVADTAGRLFAEGGYDAVSIEAVAEQLSVSRATLYRTVPTKERLLDILFERSTQNLDEAVTALIAEHREPADELTELVCLHINAAIETRHYMAVFFGGAGVSQDVYQRWQKFSHSYEQRWLGVVKRAMGANVLHWGDPVLTTRLLLGMVIWVSRWYRGSEKFTAAQITETAVGLIRQHAPQD